MTRTSLFSFILLLAALPVLCRAATPPNVVILLTDDQGTLDAACYGSDHLITPNIDRLAAQGTRFTQAYSHTVCCPARAALLTGRHPQRGGVNNWTQGDMKAPKGIHLALEEVTLAEVLRDAGYRTALFGKWHLGAHEDHGPKKQGFDEFFGIRGGFIDNFNHCFLHGSGFHDLYEGSVEIFAPGEYFPDMLVRRSLEFIEKNRDRPFFLHAAFNLPHYPEQAPEKFTRLYADSPDEKLRSYGPVISTVDHHIGLILDQLDRLGLADNTIVIFMSDNGHSMENFMRIVMDGHRSGLPKGHFYAASGAGNTGRWIGHKGTFLEGGIRVPAILRYPGKAPAGAVRNQIVTIMDWFPTVIDFCGIKRPADAPKPDGHSLLPILRDAGAPDAYGGVLHFEWSGGWAVRDGEWKLIGGNRWGSDERGMILHRLTDEQPELKDHAAGQPETVARLRAMHEKWLAGVTP
jgi:arylsulfatase A-like enzyme